MKSLILALFAFALIPAAEASWGPSGPKDVPYSCTYNTPDNMRSIQSQGGNVTSLCLTRLPELRNQQGLTVEYAFEASELWIIQTSRKISVSSYEMVLRYAGIWTPTAFVAANGAESRVLAKVVVNTDASGSVSNVYGLLPAHGMLDEGPVQFSASGFQHVSPRK